MTRWMTLVALLLLVLSSVSACSSDNAPSDADGDGTDGDTDNPDGDTPDGDVTDEPDGDVDPSDGEDVDGDGEATDGDPEESEPLDPELAFDPFAVMDSVEVPLMRGMRTWRGIVHAHSPYSHDACDDNPFPEGVRNEDCFNDVRNAMCRTVQDFVFLTDHSTHFAEYEFPDVILYKEGDTLITRGDLPVANRVACLDARSVVVSAGSESGMMPIGIERHVEGTIDERKAIYNAKTIESVALLREVGAKVFLQHTEEWEVETILDLGVDGIEMYNVHFNLMDNMGQVVKMALTMETEPDTLPAIELALITVFKENEADLFRWSKVLMQRELPAVLATDAHQNVFKGPSPDGERLDSFRRLMRWYSNYVLTPESEADDLIYKNAIAAGRHYGVFDYLGYAVGFDFHAQDEARVIEMGERTVGESVDLVLTMPDVWGLHPDGALQPELRALILKAADGEWDVVAEGAGDLSVTVGPGAYRAEVRMVPHHLRPWLGPKADDYLKEMIWIYSNAVYVGPAPQTTR